MRKNYTVLLFDADNTLLDFDACERAALQRTFASYDCPLHEPLKKRYMEINHALWKAYEDGEISRDEVVYTRFGKLFQEFAIPLDGVAFEKSYQAELGKGHEVVAHAMEVVEQLKQRYALYIVTNGVTATQYSRLRDSGLDRYFLKIFVSEELGFRKPMKEYFDACFSQLPHADKDGMLIIGDSLSSDMQGGINAGIDTCWYNPKRIKNEKHLPVTYEIDDLRTLLKLL